MRSVTTLAAAALACTFASASFAQCVPGWDYTISDTGIPPAPASGGYIGALTMYQGDLIASGSFPAMGSIPGASYIAKYNFATDTWSALNGGILAGPNNAFGTSFAEMNGELYVGGFWQTADGVTGTRSLARWNGTQFLPVDTGWVLPNEGGPVHSVWSMVSTDVFGGPKVFFGGSFETLNGNPAAHVAYWNGTASVPIVTSMPTLVQGASSINPLVTAMTVFDDGQGGGPQLYIGGRFNSVDGVTALTVARWNGTTWSAVGTNLGNTIVTAEVDAMKIWNGALYIGGTNLRVNGALAQVAKWDGTTWTAVGQNPTGRIWSLETFDDGSGEKLYATGTPISGGINRFFRLEGNTWTVVGGGVDAQGIKLLNTNGKLLVAGSFDNAGGLPAAKIAAWKSCACGTSDFNGDGDFGTDADIEAFFACLGGNCCATCYSGGSDFNADGDFGTDADIEAFFRVLGGGAC